MNYAETLACWYLRLNGFFPIRGWVMHGLAPRGQTTDCDVLAVRLPHVYEDTGGLLEDWDPRFRAWHLDLTTPIAMMVQVKTSAGNAPANPGDAFDRRYLTAAARRIGAWHGSGQPGDDLRLLIDAVENTSFATHRGWTLAKLLIATNAPNPGEVPYLFLSLRDAVSFMKARFAKYREKGAGRFHFADELIQFLASGDDGPEERDRGRAAAR